MSPMKKLGDYLQRKRKESGKTQRELSDHLGLKSPQYISNVERGLNLPSAFQLGEWSDFVGANKNTIFKMMMQEYRQRVRAGLEL